MATYTTPLRIKLLADGEEPVVWGQSTNTNLSTVLETAITGVKTISTGDVNYTLTANNALPDDARNAVLVFTGARTAIRTITAPNINKTYTIKNSTTGGFGITISAGSGTTVTIPNGATTQVYCDGSTGFYVVSSTIPITNVAMNSRKLTGLAVGTTTGDSVEYSQLAVELTGSFTITGTGFTVSPTSTATYKVIYGYVYLQITQSDITGTSNATSFTLTGLPVAITPSANRHLPIVSAINNGVATWAAAAVTTTSILVLSNIGVGSAWTASGTKTLKTSEFIYLL